MMHTTKPKIILASGSPRRLDILRAHGFEPEVIVPNVDEEALTAELPKTFSPQELACQLALSKARAVYELLRGMDDANANPNTLILGADTVVYKEGVGILGKPGTHKEAVAMLTALCNTSHQVVTGVALIAEITGEEASLADTTTVSFGSYSLANIEDYLTREPPFDKAGSYAIQGYWNRYVTAVEGDLENVIGLPYHCVEDYLNHGERGNQS